MRWIATDDVLCLYLELTDAQLERVRGDKYFFKDDAFAVECYKEKGDNAHCFSLVINGKADILAGIRLLLADYKTVSWWSPKGVFVIKRRV